MYSIAIQCRPRFKSDFVASTVKTRSCSRMYTPRSSCLPVVPLCIPFLGQKSVRQNAIDESRKLTVATPSLNSLRTFLLFLSLSLVADQAY